METEAITHATQICETADLVEKLAQQGEIDLSTLSFIKQLLSKHAIVSAASHLETTALEAVREFFSGLPEPLQAFVDGQAIHMQFMRLFDFKAENSAGRLLGSFGDAGRTLKTAMKSDCVAEARAFTQLCAERNRLVHNNYATLDASFSPKETRDLLVGAERFIEWLRVTVGPIVRSNTGDVGACGSAGDGSGEYES